MLNKLLLLTGLLFISIAQANTLQQMQSELDSAQYARATTTGLALLREQPDNIQLKFLTAVAFQKNNQIKQAIRYYQSVIEQRPDLPEPRNNLAIIYLQQGNYEQAINLLIASLKTHPAYATAYTNLNNIYQGLASEAYRKALSDETDSSSVLNQIKLTELDELHLPQQPDTDITMVARSATTEAAVITPPPTAPPPVQTATIERPAQQPARQTPDYGKQQLVQLVKDWAAAWSNQQFDQYAAAYNDSYRGRYNNHAQWLKQRYRRIVQRDTITVTLDNIKIKSLSDHQAVIDFEQAYQSPSYSDRVVKRLRLIKVGKLWKINKEVTLSVL